LSPDHHAEVKPANVPNGEPEVGTQIVFFVPGGAPSDSLECADRLADPDTPGLLLL
jgi:hypothetical protein